MLLTTGFDPLSTGQLLLVGPPLRRCYLTEEPRYKNKCVFDICFIFFGQADLLDETGASPVHLGILSGNPDTVGVFVAAGLVTKFNPTSNFFFRIKKRHPGLGSTRDQESRTPLMWAAALGKDDVLGSLEGVELDAKDEQGYSALHIAVSAGLTASVAALVEMGADLKAGTKDGQTALLLATNLLDPGITSLLLRHGATTSQMDQNGRTGLHLAAQAGRLEQVQLLLRAGAKVDPKDKWGRTPLSMACWGGHQEVDFTPS